METLSILVVDDEHGMRKGVHRVLDGFYVDVSEVDTEVAFNVHAAESGEEALKEIEKEKIHILLLDHKLPNMSGIDVLEEISQQKQDMLVIMIASYASPSRRLSGQQNWGHMIFCQNRLHLQN